MNEDRIKSNVERILDAVRDATLKAGRLESDVSVLAATKYTDRVGVEAVIRAGVGLIGENRMQDALDKLGESLDGAQKNIHAVFPSCRLHLIPASD